MTHKRLGLLAGAGALPQTIAYNLHVLGVPFSLVNFDGISSPEGYPDVPSRSFPLGKVGSIFAHLKEQDVENLIISGYFPKPTLKDLQPDWTAARWMAHLAFARGDNHYLTELAGLIEAEGFHIQNPDVYLAGCLTFQSGAHTKRKPTKAHLRSIERAREVMTFMSPADVGQALVVQGQTVIAIEAVEGTNALIQRSQQYLKSGGGVLVKMCKSKQDMRLDRPTIGLATLQLAHEVGLDGIAVDAEHTYVLEKQEMIDYANQHKLFLIAIDPLS